LEHLTTFGKSDYATENLQLFRDVDDVRKLLADCPVLRVSTGATLMDTNNRGGCLFIVLRGALHYEPMTAPGGGADGSTARILPGECVGELSVLDEEASPAKISALQQTEVLMITADRLWKMIEESNHVARNLLRLLSFRVRAANAQLRRRQKVGEFYRQLSILDGLTGLHNRAWLDQSLPNLIQTAHAEAKPLSVVMIDLDHFKQFNDTYGHLAGDQALKTASRVLSNALRPTDFAARYGGEELLVILPESNQSSGAMVALRLCERLQQAAVLTDMHKALPHITASFGVAGLLPNHDANGLLGAADAALYRAKKAGRNCVVEAL
jgi:diguanylate cyclase